MTSDEVDDYFRKDEALERVDGDTELLFELVEIFFEDYQDGVDSIEKSITEGDSKSLEQKAHSIKSALGNLGAMHAYHLAQRMEQRGRENKLEGLLETVIELKDSVSQFQQRVNLLRS